jgi:hypothetical protein
MTALVAVIVSPLVSWFIAKHQITASNVSSKRQVWIDELRRDVAKALAFTSRIEDLKRPSPELGEEEQLDVFDRKMNAELQTVELLMRIKLRLNPNEQEHNDLIAAFRELANAGPDPQPGETDADRQKLLTKFRAERDNVLGITQTILKSEWDRVRKGE